MNLPWVEGLQESEKLLRAFASAIWKQDGGSSCEHSRVPKVADGLDIVVFLVFTAALVALNWGVRLFIVQPLAYRILRGPKKTVLLRK